MIDIQGLKNIGKKTQENTFNKKMSKNKEGKEEIKGIRGKRTKNEERENKNEMCKPAAAKWKTRDSCYGNESNDAPRGYNMR